MFTVQGKTEEGYNETLNITARCAKDIWSNPKNFGFSKVYKVSPLSNRRSRTEERELKYT
jgi:hypothetical protein